MNSAEFILVIHLQNKISSLWQNISTVATDILVEESMDLAHQFDTLHLKFRNTYLQPYERIISDNLLLDIQNILNQIDIVSEDRLDSYEPYTQEEYDSWVNRGCY